MEEKLKSITKRTPWSSLLRGLVLGLAHYALAPFDFGSGALFFVVIAFAFYLIPFFRPKATRMPFFAALILALLLSQGILAAGAVVLLFALLFALKDLEVVDRAFAYEIFVFLALFASALQFFRAVPHWGSPLGIGGALGIGALFYVLSRRMSWRDDGEVRAHATLDAFVSAAILFEVSMAILFLPIDFISQACLLFTLELFGVIFVETRRLRHIGAFLIVIGIILSISSWKL